MVMGSPPGMRSWPSTPPAPPPPPLLRGRLRGFRPLPLSLVSATSTNDDHSRDSADGEHQHHHHGQHEPDEPVHDPSPSFNPMRWNVSPPPTLSASELVRMIAEARFGFQFAGG